MAKTPTAQKLDEIQASLALLLKPLGFKKGGRTFRRSFEPGVVQLINLQMSQWGGRFTVNLSVFIEEAFTAYFSQPAPKTIPEYAGQIATRLGHLLGRGDFWWELDETFTIILDDLTPALMQNGIDFLDQFKTRDAIIASHISAADCRHHDLSKSKFIHHRARLDVAIILAKRGEMDEATRLFKEHLALTSTTKASQLENICTLAQNLGLGDLKT